MIMKTSFDNCNVRFRFQLIWFMMWAYGVKSNCSDFRKKSQYVPGSSHVWKHPDVLADIDSSESKLKWKVNEQMMNKSVDSAYFLNHTVSMLFYMTDRNVRHSNTIYNIMWNILIDKLHLIQDMHIQHYSFFELSNFLHCFCQPSFVENVVILHSINLKVSQW